MHVAVIPDARSEPDSLTVDLEGLVAIRANDAAIPGERDSLTLFLYQRDAIVLRNALNALNLRP